jgi:hypothetical protein
MNHRGDRPGNLAEIPNRRSNRWSNRWPNRWPNHSRGCRRCSLRRRMVAEASPVGLLDAVKNRATSAAGGLGSSSRKDFICREVHPHPFGQLSFHPESSCPVQPTGSTCLIGRFQIRNLGPATNSLVGCRVLLYREREAIH